MTPDSDPEDSFGPSARFEKLSKQLLDHLETRWEYATLTFTEKMSAVVSTLVAALVAGLFFIMVLFFLCVALALWVGDLIGNRAGGFALSAIIFVPFGLASYYLIRPILREKIIQNILSDEDLPKES